MQNSGSRNCTDQRPPPSQSLHCLGCPHPLNVNLSLAHWVYLQEGWGGGTRGCIHRISSHEAATQRGRTPSGTSLCAHGCRVNYHFVVPGSTEATGEDRTASLWRPPSSTPCALPPLGQMDKHIDARAQGFQGWLATMALSPHDLTHAETGWCGDDVP